MFCQFSTVQQNDPVIDICIPFLTLSSIMFHHKWLHIVSWATQQDLIAYPLQIQSFSSINPKFPIHPTPPWQTQVMENRLVLICISLIIMDVEHFFHMSVSHMCVFFGKTSIQVLYPFFLKVKLFVCFLILSCVGY